MQAKLRKLDFVIIDFSVFELEHKTLQELGIYAAILYSIKKFGIINYEYILNKWRMPQHLVEECVLDLIRLNIIVELKN